MMSHRLLRSILAFLLAVPLAASAAGEVPLPRSKPEPAAAPVPLPRSKPTPTAPAASAVASKQWPADRGRWSADEVDAARRQCASLLSGIDMIWRPDHPIGATGGCGTPAPIAVAEIDGVRINPPATINCQLALSLHDWLSGSVQPAARRQLHTEVTEIRNASSYACRRRNNASSGKLSEHAKANAFDMAAFVFKGNAEVSVKGDWSGLFQFVGLSGRGNFLRTIRKSSCDYFNTVLGPGTDRFHKDHFHVDLMPLRPGRFKMCR